MLGHRPDNQKVAAGYQNTEQVNCYTQVWDLPPSLNILHQASVKEVSFQGADVGMCSYSRSEVMLF